MALTTSNEVMSSNLRTNLYEDCLSIPGQCCSERPLNGVFNAKNNIVVHGLGEPEQCGEAPGYTGTVAINEVNLHQEYQCTITRQLLHEMASVFSANQRPPEQQMTDDEIIYYSKSYCTVIGSIIKLTGKAKVTEAAVDADTLDDLMGSLVVSESVWSFAQIIFLQQPHGGELVNELLKWIQSHLVDCQLLMEGLLKEADISSHHDYWPAVLGCLMQGRMEECVHLLQAANNTSQSWHCAIQAIRKMPVYHTMGTTLTDFQMTWQHWQEEVNELLEQEMFCDQTMPIAQILTGDVDVIKDTAERLSLPWYAQLIAELLYTQPFAKLHQIQDMLNDCVTRTGGTGTFETHDHVMLHILKKSLVDVIKCCSEGFKSWWFAAHLSDVFYHAGYLREKNSVGTTLRESLLLQYGGSLMQDNVLWPLGARYLKQCPEHGRFHLQEYLSRLSLTSTKKALKVLRLCEQHGYSQQAVSLCRVMARKELRENRLGSALTWCRHGRDGNMATIVAERYLDQHRDQIAHSTADVLDALGSTTLLMSKNLIFLAKLREFHQCYNDSNEKKAAELLVNLISSRMAPAKYWLLILCELMPLLESNQKVFTTSQIYCLMNALSELLQSRQVVDVDKNKVDSLQLSLSRCLAMAMILDVNTLQGITCE